MNGLSEYWIGFNIIWIFIVFPVLWGLGIALLIKVFKFTL